MWCLIPTDESTAASTPCSCFPERCTFFLCGKKWDRVRILCSLHSVCSFILLINLVNDVLPSAQRLRKWTIPPHLQLLSSAVGEANLLSLGLFSDGLLLSPNSTNHSLATCHSSSYSSERVSFTNQPCCCAPPPCTHTHTATDKHRTLSPWQPFAHAVSTGWWNLAG